ncbi:MAG: hypothetical protein Q4C50_05265 [Eubacteriales bacterium]|nr:hypothetical protein [Eubacteriales bacterium]
MKEYEVVWEIFNLCSNNQMRDVFIEEAEIADTQAYVEQKFAGKDVTYEKSVLENGTIVYDIMTSGIRQRMSFTEI